jgi:hypothetical protein
MKKLVFIFALLCCSMQVMAADLCAGLQAKCLTLVANGYNGVLGPVDFNGGFLQADIKFSGSTPDPVIGSCVNGHIAFTRVHQGQGAFTQFYSGLFSGSSNVSGTYIHGSQTAQHFNWNATLGACPLPPPPPSAAHKACVADCQANQDECGPLHPCSGTVYNNCVKACPP